ncbi:hypothetical protein PTTG_11861 [Puccinia triticina 1-1 BBBD Race 1]|uniref:Uncharacterized protein n=1 Tax=Puccinia triticina (isolate 1-1 / race 1 (BBBD)) TaxID=630390 RepID=A0A180GM40_PUCT1|nr:hypothetical protein PTTG_11861 [Puccinia triticina 1-1 BBBD Race 1]
MFSRLIAIAYFAGLFSLGFLDRPPRKTWEKPRFGKLYGLWADQVQSLSTIIIITDR